MCLLVSPVGGSVCLLVSPVGGSVCLLGESVCLLGGSVCLLVSLAVGVSVFVSVPCWGQCVC